MATTNALFALFAVSNPAGIEAKLAQTYRFPLISIKTSESSWFVITPLSVLTRELSDLLGITDGSVSSAVLVRVENYFGRANKDIWEWLGANMSIPVEQSLRAEVTVGNEGGLK